MTPEVVLDTIKVLLAAGRDDLALQHMALAMGQAHVADTGEPRRSKEAERKAKYRAAKRDMSHGTERDMSHGTQWDSEPGDTAQVVEIQEFAAAGQVGHVHGTAAGHVPSQGKGGRGVGVLLEESGVVADSGNTGSMLPMVLSTPMALSRPAAVEAVKGKLVHMADARERRENKHRGEAELVFRYWQAKLGHTKAMFSRDREAKIVARLREGSTPDELCYAIDGIAKSAFHTGENDRGMRYDGIDLLFRNRTNVERFASAIKAFGRGEPHPFVAEATAAVQMAVQQPAGATISGSGGVAYA